MATDTTTRTSLAELARVRYPYTPLIKACAYLDTYYPEYSDHYGGKLKNALLTLPENPATAPSILDLANIQNVLYEYEKLPPICKEPYIDRKKGVND